MTGEHAILTHAQNINLNFTNKTPITQMDYYAH